MNNELYYSNNTNIYPIEKTDSKTHSKIVETKLYLQNNK